MTASPDLPKAGPVPVEVPRPRASAGLIGLGLVLLVLGGALSFFGIGADRSAFGFFLVVAGGLTLAFGAHRAGRNLDSIAAAVYNESLRRDSE